MVLSKNIKKWGPGSNLKRSLKKGSKTCFGGPKRPSGAPFSEKRPPGALVFGVWGLKSLKIATNLENGPGTLFLVFFGKTGPGGPFRGSRTREFFGDFWIGARF